MWIVAINESRRLMRSGKLVTLVALTLLLAIVGTVGTTWWWAQEVGKDPTLHPTVAQLQPAEPSLGLRLTWATLVLLLPVCFIAMPVLTADMIAGEREDGTLEMLELTALRPRELVLGKFLAASAAVVVLAASTLPFLVLADLAGGPRLVDTFALIGAAVLYCLPFAAAGLGRSVRSATRAEAVRSTFRDMLLWPLIGVAIAGVGIVGVALLRYLLGTALAGNPIAFWTIHLVSFPAGFVWTDVWDAIGRTPWFWLGVPVALTIHSLRRAWVVAAWLEPMRVAETVQARRREPGRRPAVSGRPPASWASIAPQVSSQAALSAQTTPWARVSRRLRNPVEVLATITKHDGAWYFAALGWILPLVIIGLPLAVNPENAKGRGFYPSFAAFAWIGLLLGYVCMVAPTIITSEREGGTLDALRMTRLGAAEIVLGKVKPRLMEVGLLIAGGAGVISVFCIWGSLSPGSLLLAWASGVIYPLAYAGFGAAASVWCQRSTHAILATWSALGVPIMLSLAMVSIAGVIGRFVILPLAPLLVMYRCLVFMLPDPTAGGVYLPAREAYAIWGLSLLIHLVIGALGWWVALKRFDRFLYENRSGG